MPNTFVIGDIHGSYRALLQCLSISGFNYQADTLICLGDVSDGWPETSQAVGELLKVRNLIYILGNHDFWTLDWMETGYADSVWLSQGGQATVDSYMAIVPESHLALFRQGMPYYIYQNKLFVHAGINADRPLTSQGIQTFLWDRNFARKAQALDAIDKKNRLTEFDAVFIGHTPIKENQPVKYCEVWMMDTGAGWSGRLSMMNIDTNECFVSDPVPDLYPGVEGRKKF